MINLAKGLFSLVLGVSGVGGLVYGVASSSYLDTSKVEATGPILTCKDGSYGRWEVFLAKAENGEKDLGEKTTFRVFQYNGSELTGKQIPWSNMAKKDDDWTDFRLTFEDGSLELWFAEKKIVGYHMTHLVRSCQDSRIELVDSSKNQGEHNGIESTTIRFTVDKESCKDSLTEGCNIQFSTGTNLKWKEGFQPKIFYSYS